MSAVDPGLTLSDEWELRRLAERYAYAVDRNDGAALAALFTPDGVLDSITGTYVGREVLSTIPAMVRSRYVKTFHGVLSQLPVATADGAEAETYCIARHLIAGSDVQDARCHELTIRYQDRFVRIDGQWRFAVRRLNVDWTQTYPIKVPQATVVTSGG